VSTEEAEEIQLVLQHIVALYLVMTFGWVGAPGAFMAVTWIMKQLHASHRLKDRSWHDIVPFHSFFLVDDQVLVEPHLGLRAPMSVALAEACTQQVLGKDSLNAAKDAEEGRLETLKLIWGIIYDSVSETRELPAVKLEKAFHLLHDPGFDYGNFVTPLRLWQELRGNQEFWLAVMPQLTPLLRATNKLLGPADSTGLAQAKGTVSQQVRTWQRAWNAVELQRSLVENQTEWATRFTHPMLNGLSLREALALPGNSRKVIWTSGDATLERVAAIDWSSGTAYSCEARPIFDRLVQILTVSQEETRKLVERFMWEVIARGEDTPREDAEGKEGDSTESPVLPRGVSPPAQAGEDEGAGPTNLEAEDMLIVALTELLTIVVLAVLRKEDWRGGIILYAGDNDNVVVWMTKRQAGNDVACYFLLLISALEVTYSFRIHALYWRTYHNITADALTREDAERVMKAKGLTALALDGWELLLDQNWARRALIWSGQSDKDQ
jgi:hypothetical protein